MNKTAIKNYAVWARNKLIADIEYKAGLIGITENGIATALPQSTSEVQFFDIGTKEYASIRGREINQRNALVSAIHAKETDGDYKKAFHFVVEKVAYTWFNRLVAIRFMEVNDYLPSRVRVLSSENENKAEPDMVTRPFDTDMSFSQQEEDLILKLKDENQLDELFRWLFIKQCHKLHDVLPLLFSPETLSSNQNDYMELLLTISFTDKDGVLWHLVHDIREQDYRIRTPEDDERQRIENIAEEDMPAGQVEIIGWMYQYYNTEPKDQVFADLKKNIKISKDKIPAATQLFTPDWIVRYMVENSLGRLWVEGHPNEVIKKNWKYYLEEAEQEPEVQKQLAEIRRSYAAIRPEEIKVIDPCMGSGHILVYLFEVLMQIYESQGWTQREAAQSIIQNNLYGLDIDERAAQLAYFAVMMKARQYDRRFLERGIEPHVYEIQESNTVDFNLIDYFSDGNKKLKADISKIISELLDAKEYGSILSVTSVDFSAIYARFDEIKEDINFMAMMATNELLPLVKRAEAMAQKYDVVVTNPPYMGSDGMDAKLSAYIKKKYPECKADLFAVFIDRCSTMLNKLGYQAMITQHSWMFLSSFDKFRRRIIHTATIVNMAHLGARAFEEISGEVVQTVAWVMKRGTLNYIGTYSRLVEPTTQNEKERMFLSRSSLYFCKQKSFENIPNTPVAYWISKDFQKVFNEGRSITEYVTSRDGLTTGNNDLFIRYFWEVSLNNINFGSPNADRFWESGKKYAPLIKGGLYRKWYGNNWFVITYDKPSFERLSQCGNKLPSREIYFYPYINWNRISTRMAFRYCEQGYLFESASLVAFSSSEDDMMFALSFANSVLARNEMQLINPTTNMLSGYVDSLCLPNMTEKKKQECINDAKRCVEMAKSDWDELETSWDFLAHPLLGKGSIKSLAEAYENKCRTRFDELKMYEQKINRMFVDTAGLDNEFDTSVPDDNISVKKPDMIRDVKGLISYAVGCMFGRFSLKIEGLVYAGGIWDSNKYSSFIPDEDNCIPITDEPYFEDDIVGRFTEFIRIVYGEDKLEENLSFIANVLGNKGNSSREVIRYYFLNDFIKDHNKLYQKRPIYWLFDSGKQNGFKALVYMHRWNADTIGNLRVEYLHRIQRVYEKEIVRMQDIVDSSHDNREINQASKRREKLVKQLKEARDYDVKIAHAALSRVEIDLDDGVKVNYEKVQKGPDGKSLGILAKI